MVVLIASKSITITPGGTQIAAIRTRHIQHLQELLPLRGIIRTTTIRIATADLRGRVSNVQLLPTHQRHRAARMQAEVQRQRLRAVAVEVRADRVQDRHAVIN